MRKIAEIRNDVAAKRAEAEKIDRSDVSKLEAITKEINDLLVELSAANAVEAAAQATAERKLQDLQKREGRQFSLLKFVRELSEGDHKLTGLEAEVAEMGREEYLRMGLTPVGAVIPGALLRAAAGQNYTTAADGGNLVETMATKYVENLKEKLVVTKLGATILTDLVGTLPVVTSSQISAGWGAEAAAATTSKASFAKATMTPHRNYVQTAFTKDLLKQTSFDVEGYLIKLMTEAHANLLESAAIAGAGNNNQPTGILSASGTSSVAIGTNGGPITWAKVVELESKVNAENANRGRLGYLTNAKVVGDLKTIERAQGTARFLLDGDFTRLNGYAIEWTNLVPSNLTKGTSSQVCSAMIFGNFEDLFIGEWGGLDIVVDPYTKAGSGEVVMTVNAWNDVLVAQPKSFAKIVDLTTNA